MAKNYIRLWAGGVAAVALIGAAAGAAAQQHGASGSEHSDHADHEAGSKGAGSKGGQGGGHTGEGKGGGKSMEDIFRDVGSAAASAEDSDRPEWAGEKGGKSGQGGGKPATSGSKKGDLYGDQWVILRDENGVPILTPEGFVQPLDASGNLIPLDEEGAPLDPSLTVEVSLDRLNVGRAGSQVLDRRADEVVAMLNDATAVSLDPAGRLVVTVDGVANTIDSPLENLAIYVALMTTGSIPGVGDLPGTELDHLVDGKLTPEDMEFAASFLAAASDKTSPITLDEVAYLNAILGVNTTTTGDVTYSVVDYSEFSYDRSDAYSGVKADVLVLQPDGSYKTETVDVYDAVFSGTDYSGSGTLSTFTQAVDDLRSVVEYLHEMAVPADSTATPTSTVTEPTKQSVDKVK